jgi:hypothetical protein
MERGSTKHGPKLDDELQHETENMMRSGQATHAEEFKETEAILGDESDEFGAGGAEGLDAGDGE